MIKTQHCECGNETYNIKFNGEGKVWAVCSECGRPTGSVGIGQEKKRAWASGNDDRAGGPDNNSKEDNS